MRHGFTLIELIFVIVIIGILSAIAIPKFSATRDDAKSIALVQNLTACIHDIGAAYTATQEESTGTATDGSDTYGTCKLVADAKCLQVTGVENSGSDGNITIDGQGVNNSKNWCKSAIEIAYKKNLVGLGGSPKTIEFGGTHIKFN
jgi:general secretion pathway protein G